jgi:osmotically-inducible protein OsmY
MGLALALGGLLLAGCSGQQDAQVRQGVQGIRQEFRDAAAVARQKTADAALAASVKAALAARKGLAAGGIKVGASGTTVTLSGDVTSPEQAALAERTAAETKGVEAVQNRLTMRIPATPGAAAAGTTTPVTPQGQ